MNTVLRYFRQHRWQRRILTSLTAAILGVIAAWAIWPTMRDIRIIDRLGSADPIQRESGIVRAVALAKKRPQLIDRIERRLDSAPDTQFIAMVEVLSRLGRFRTPARKGEQLDRFHLVNFAAAEDDPSSVDVRQIMLHRIILDGRDNVHVRKVLQLSAGDAAAEIRSAAAVLAARLADDETLLRLLADAEPQVRAAAAIDAALAGRTACTETIATALNQVRLKADQVMLETDEEWAAFAYALAKLGPKKYGRDLAARINHPWIDNQIELLDKMLCAAPLLKDDLAGEVVVGILRDARRRKKTPPTMALVAAGKMQLRQAEPFIAETIADLVARGVELTVGEAVTLAAAVNAAGRLKMPPQLFVEVMEKLWHPGTSPAMILSAEALTEQAAIKTENRNKVLSILRTGAKRSDTPVPASAAAVAMFMLSLDKADEALQTTCKSETHLAGDYVAWNLARTRRAGAWRIAGAFLGPGVYDKAVRSTGAILLALLARKTDRATQAADAIESRLKEEIRRGERDPFIAGSYRCALLILGRAEFADKVAALAETDAFSKRRALTALALGGEPAGFDMVFGARRFNAAEIDSVLTGRLMARVYSAIAPEMPAFDIDAPAHIRHWQCRILRDFYLIHRRAILGRIRP